MAEIIKLVNRLRDEKDYTKDVIFKELCQIRDKQTGISHLKLLINTF